MTITLIHRLHLPKQLGFNDALSTATKKREQEESMHFRFLEKKWLIIPDKPTNKQHKPKNESKGTMSLYYNATKLTNY